MAEIEWPREDIVPEAVPRGPTLEAMSRQIFRVRPLYPDLDFVTIDFLFLCFLTLYSRFGRFSYGPISVECRVVERMFERTYNRLAPGVEPGGHDESAQRLYRRVATELVRSGGRRVDELHWLLAFMRTDEGLPGRVFGELGIAPETVERYAKSEAPVEPPDPARRQPGEKLYTPEEVAEYLGVHVQTVRVWIRSGKLPARKLAGLRALRIRETDLEAVLEPVDPTTVVAEGAR